MKTNTDLIAEDQRALAAIASELLKELTEAQTRFKIWSYRDGYKDSMRRALAVVNRYRHD